MTPSTEHSNNTTEFGTRRGWLLAFSASLITALAIVSPFFWLGSASGHDFGFHAASWVDVAGQWKEGIVYPRWAEWADYGFGEPRFIFYPPLSWLLGAALGSVVQWHAVPGVFIVLVQTIAGLCAYALARKWLPMRAAVFSAMCYAANPYALVVIYMRSDFAEQLAAAFFPLLLLKAMDVGDVLESRPRVVWRALAGFSVVFAIVWLSNAPAGVMASYSVALLFAWLALTGKSWTPLTRGFAGLALGFGLTAFYLVPAASEQRWVNIAQALASGLKPTENFLFTQINDPEHNLFNWIASSVAILLIVLTGIAALAGRPSVENQDGKEERMWRAILLLVAAATLLMLPPTAIFWMLLPKLRFVQFPWRWMAVLAVGYAYFLGAAAGRVRMAWIWIAGVLAISAGAGTFLVQQAWWDSEDIPVLRAAMQRDAGFDGTDEYDPMGDDHYSLPEKAPRWEVLDATSDDTVDSAVKVERWDAEHREFRVTAKKPVRLAVRLQNYPAWSVEVNRVEVSPGRAEAFNQMIVPLEAGESSVRIRFVRTRDRTVGGAISLASLLALAAAFWAGKARNGRD
jgi:hypothetical protein